MSSIAQPSKIYVQSVAFENLEKTKESFLYSLIETRVGIPLDSSILESDRQLLTNLEMFANFTYSVELDSSAAKVTFTATEIRSLLPIASFGRIDENFWVMAGISEVNLSGKGHKLVTYYQHYDRSSFAGHLTLNRINRSDWSVNINAVKWGTREPLFFDAGSVEQKGLVEVRLD
jgi:outer membrane protein assembly factor BamA